MKKMCVHGLGAFARLLFVRAGRPANFGVVVRANFLRSAVFPRAGPENSVFARDILQIPMLEPACVFSDRPSSRASRPKTCLSAPGGPEKLRFRAGNRQYFALGPFVRAF